MLDVSLHLVDETVISHKIYKITKDGEEEGKERKERYYNYSTCAHYPENRECSIRRIESEAR